MSACARVYVSRLNVGVGVRWGGVGGGVCYRLRGVHVHVSMFFWGGGRMLRERMYVHTCECVCT